jgi:hypothetical protein
VRPFSLWAIPFLFQSRLSFCDYTFQVVNSLAKSITVKQISRLRCEQLFASVLGAHQKAKEERHGRINIFIGGIAQHKHYSNIAAQESDEN